MRRLNAGKADTDTTFCALVVSVCAATIATLPRGDYGPLTVSKCVDFIEEHHLLQRSFMRPSYSVDWCIAMYNIGVSINTYAEGGMSDMRCYDALTGAAAGARYLLFNSQAHTNRIEQQMLRRLYWLLFAAAE